MMPYKQRASFLFGALILIVMPCQAVHANDDRLADHHEKRHNEKNHRPEDTLERQIYYLQQRVAALEAQLNGLNAQLVGVAAIGQYMSLESVNGHPTVRFTGVNVQVVNGAGSTATANGTGNLIVGYDERDISGFAHCTIGTNPSTQEPVRGESACIDAGGAWITTGFKTGSHYLVLGTQNNYSRWGALVAGINNTSNYDYASVSAGNINTASGPNSIVSGGYYSTASGTSSAVSGGYANLASGLGSVVGGGTSNIASGFYSSATGGSGNTASGIGSSVSGGNTNTASGIYSSVTGGGFTNVSSGAYASIAGGSTNTASGNWSSISGGNGNVASGLQSSVLGGNGQSATMTYQTIPPLP